ncbi:hypothetical protein JD844_005747 [Phrynosoma platyrhinos]|uniref:UPAR/Ly6 domain-containing protein n=1 Tax=Phrynosoma platyrhinos TaxID=52577 RepID=A0ABQ7TNM7_PHRPL|nr:hypothetical protein JD844_005747 [Phrynosoma platyrhinos]
MMWVPPRLVLFFVLVRTGAPLECEVCSGLGKSCTGKMHTCLPNHDTCVIVLTESTLDGKMVQTVVKGCESSTICNYPISHLNMGRGRFLRISVVCCTEKTCGKDSPQLLPIETKLNGKQCPACYSWIVPCNPFILDCTGTEEYCFDVSSRIYAAEGIKDLNMQGCTTKSVCNSINHGNTPNLEGVDTVVLKAHCQPDPSRASHSSGLLLLTFFGLLLLKIL